MNALSKWLADPDASDDPFPYQFGNQLKSKTKNIQEAFRNAQYNAPEHCLSLPHWITYYSETDRGEIIILTLNELKNCVIEKVGVDR